MVNKSIINSSFFELSENRQVVHSTLKCVGPRNQVLHSAFCVNDPLKTVPTDRQLAGQTEPKIASKMLGEP